jgi:hypothetical protein
MGEEVDDDSAVVEDFSDVLEFSSSSFGVANFYIKCHVKDIPMHVCMLSITRTFYIKPKTKC